MYIEHLFVIVISLLVLFFKISLYYYKYLYIISNYYLPIKSFSILGHWYNFIKQNYLYDLYYNSYAENYLLFYFYKLLLYLLQK